jgi:anti-sigma B factor antagonist
MRKLDRERTSEPSQDAMTSAVPPRTSEQDDNFAIRWRVTDGSLRLGTRFDGSTFIIAVAGELDLTNGGTLTAELQRSERTEADTVIVDMRELEFIDSTGVAILVSAWRRTAADGRRMEVVPSTHASVRRVFDLTGLNARLPVAAEPPPN